MWRAERRVLTLQKYRSGRGSVWFPATMASGATLVAAAVWSEGLRDDFSGLVDRAQDAIETMQGVEPADVLHMHVDDRHSNAQPLASALTEGFTSIDSTYATSGGEHPFDLLKRIGYDAKVIPGVSNLSLVTSEGGESKVVDTTTDSAQRFLTDLYNSFAETPQYPEVTPFLPSGSTGAGLLNTLITKLQTGDVNAAQSAFAAIQEWVNNNALEPTTTENVEIVAANDAQHEYLVLRAVAGWKESALETLGKDMSWVTTSDLQNNMKQHLLISQLQSIFDDPYTKTIAIPWDRSDVKTGNE